MRIASADFFVSKQDPCSSIGVQDYEWRLQHAPTDRPEFMGFEARFAERRKNAYKMIGARAVKAIVNNNWVRGGIFDIEGNEFDEKRVILWSIGDS